jgi:hypothetical protein
MQMSTRRLENVFRRALGYGDHFPAGTESIAAVLLDKF